MGPKTSIFPQFWSKLAQILHLSNITSQTRHRTIVSCADFGHLPTHANIMCFASCRIRRLRTSWLCVCFVFANTKTELMTSTARRPHVAVLSLSPCGRIATSRHLSCHLEELFDVGNEKPQRNPSIEFVFKNSHSAFMQCDHMSYSIQRKAPM